VPMKKIKGLTPDKAQEAAPKKAVAIATIESKNLTAELQKFANGTGSATIETEQGGVESVKNEVVLPPTILKSSDGLPAHIEVGLGMTLNLGNYQSARVDVKLNMPCNAANVGQSYDEVYQWVSDKVEGVIESIKAETD
jgi:hypothetical protein